jgi:hypothetical protein
MRNDNSRGIPTFREFLDILKSFRILDFDNFVSDFLERKVDRKIAIEELDKALADLQSFILSASIVYKQKYLLTEILNEVNPPDTFYTKQEVAIRYRVSGRTVSNWIVSGLEAIEIGGIVRISQQAIDTFVKTNKRKKFHWRSLGFNRLDKN